jgi:hypothetical protein
MENAATERVSELRNCPAGGKKVRNAKKILTRWNEPKTLLKIKQLAFSGAQRRTAFSGQKPPTKVNNTAKNPPLVGHFPFCAAPHEQAHP